MEGFELVLDWYARVCIYYVEHGYCHCLSCCVWMKTERETDKNEKIPGPN